MTTDFVGLEEFFDYKNRLMLDLLTNPEIVRLLDDNYSITPPVKAQDLVYKQVFPYEYVPDTVEHGQTFICCEADIRRINEKSFMDIELYVWVFTHESKLRLPDRSGIRTDKLSSEISKVLNGSRFYGLGTLNLYAAKRFSPIQQYQGRTLLFVGRDWNHITPNMPIPSNRKAGV